MTMRSKKLLVLSAMVSAGALLALPAVTAGAAEGPSADVIAGMSRERPGADRPGDEARGRARHVPGRRDSDRPQGPDRPSGGAWLPRRREDEAHDGRCRLHARLDDEADHLGRDDVDGRGGIAQAERPVSNWLPELKDMKVEVRRAGADGQSSFEDVKAERPITVQDLLRHTSGFFYAGSVRSPRLKEMYDKANIEGRDADITGDEMLKRLGEIPLAHQPGTTFEYSISTDVLGLRIERVARMPAASSRSASSIRSG